MILATITIIITNLANWLITGAMHARQMRQKGAEWQEKLGEQHADHQAQRRCWELEREALLRRAIIGEGFAGYVGRDSSIPPRAA